MICRIAARTIFVAAFLFAAPAVAQENTGGTFYADCWIADGPAITMVLDNHLRITISGSAAKADDAYRTKAQTFEGENQTMAVSLCDAKMDNCKDIEAVLTTYKADDETVEANIEYFDGTETQGDSESIQGHMASFKVQRDKTKTVAICH
jgi:hypothetical protein